MVLVLAIDTRAMSKVAVILPISAPVVARREVRCEVQVGQLAVLVEEHAWPLDRREHVRGAVVVLQQTNTR